MTQGERRQASQAQPLKAKQKQAKERKKAQARNRVVIDMPQDLEEQLKRLADYQGCPNSQVVVVLARVGVAAMLAGLFDLDAHPRERSKSPRYEFNLDLSTVEIILPDKGHP